MALGEGGIVGVVPDAVSGGVGEGVEVPVGVLGQHDGWMWCQFICPFIKKQSRGEVVTYDS